MPTYRSRVLERRRLSGKSFELRFSRPEGLAFRAGQHLCVDLGGVGRDYSLVSGPGDPDLALCVREFPGGKVSPGLAALRPGDPLVFSGPRGHFTFRPSERPAVFVATGTGIAPFVSMGRDGVRGFTLVQGVREPEDLYYADLLREWAGEMVPCLSGNQEGRALPGGAFAGRVTEYVDRVLPRWAYDFYLCGREEMIRDVTLLVDDAFPDSRVYAEIFFAG